MRYFAYGTTQKGFPHHTALGLGEPVARLRVYGGHGIVVPREPACSNPACRYLHRMAVLCQGTWNLQPEGDVFEIDEAMLDQLDSLELAGPYARVEVDLSDGSPALAYRAVPPLPWINLANVGLADVVDVYEHAEAVLKPCCQADPGHDGPHDVKDPLDPDRYAIQSLAISVRAFIAGSMRNLHILEAKAAQTPGIGPHVHAAIINHRHDRDALVRALEAVMESQGPR
jgi:hypothetical protein